MRRRLVLVYGPAGPGPVAYTLAAISATLTLLATAGWPLVARLL